MEYFFVIEFQLDLLFSKNHKLYPETIRFQLEISMNVRIRHPFYLKKEIYLI